MPNQTIDVNQTVIPFGPQHPVLPEPIQLKLTLDDETVARVLPALGYIHRGIEKACEKNEYSQNIFLVERVCGICSAIHSMAYSMAIEQIMGVTPPRRAQYLRVIWTELHRLHSHLLWLGFLTEAFGFESLFMQLWRAREMVMDVLEKTAGNRVIISVCQVGGVRRDISDEHLREILETLEEVERQLDVMVPVVINDYTVRKRTVGKGVLTREQVVQLGAVGPVACASGIAHNIRMTGYGAYGELGFEPVVETGGDSYARTLVRARESYQIIQILRKAINGLLDGDLLAKPRGNPKGRALVRLEAPRGELLYFVAANGSRHLERMRIPTPTFANVPALLAMLQGCEFADVPVITLSIDPCISCTER